MQETIVVDTSSKAKGELRIYGKMKRLLRCPCLLLLIATAPVTNGWAASFSPNKKITRTAVRTEKASLSVLALHASSPSSSQDAATTTATTTTNANFIVDSFTSKTECDDLNTPPSLGVILQSLEALSNTGSDIRGRFVDHAPRGSLASVAHAIKAAAAESSSHPALTPFAAYCYGHALAQQLLIDETSEKEQQQQRQQFTIAIGIDPRSHGMRLADSFARGAESWGPDINVVFAGIATTPACAAFCRSGKCDAAVMITASHLPKDRNGFKFFSKAAPTGYSKLQIQALAGPAKQCASECRDILPPSSGPNAVMCSQHNHQWMPDYAESLKQAILSKTKHLTSHPERPLEGLTIILNSGNGSGGFFQTVLEDLGADASHSLHLQPDGSFPNGIPNPEDAAMLKQTITACEAVQADLAIMLDTDADRCGFVVPRGTTYEPLNRNRLIALLGVIFAEASPGCAVVTDSVTSEGLATFLQDNLKLQHVRYLKGYANVINLAKELTQSGTMNAELAIETSGHCAMRENDFLDDGTYTAVQILSLLAREKQVNPNANLLDLIAELEEMDEVAELRMTTKDGSLETMQAVFDVCVAEIEARCNTPDGAWTLDEDNLEGIRVRLGNNGQFFMLRKSLHDPLVSLQIESQSKAEARRLIIDPLVSAFQSNPSIDEVLDTSVLETY